MLQCRKPKDVELWQAKGLCVLSQRSLCVSSYLVLVSQQFFIEETAGSRGVTPGLQNKPQNRRNSFPTEWLNTIWLLASMKTSRIGCVNNISGYKSVSQAGIRNLFSPECGLLRVLTQIFWQNACCFPHKYLYLPRMHHTHTHTHQIPTLPAAETRRIRSILSWHLYLPQTSNMDQHHCICISVSVSSDITRAH